MSKYVLFSPVGGHDPIASYHDGALLHICRCYKPEVVYIYLSKEMAERHDKDNRYIESLNKLKEFLGYEFKIEPPIERRELTDVQIFDAFYEDFENIIDDIKNKYKDYEILLNISSGTPAMKSALNVIATLAKHKITAIQVSSPNKKENPKNEDHKSFDLELWWETNDDNKIDFENRCIEVKQLNLMAKIKKEMIVRLIKSYDYKGALSVAEDIKEFISDDAYSLINAGYNRIMLNQSGVSKALKNKDFNNIMPIQTNGTKKDIFEYLLYLQLRQRQGNYSDFIRGITPVIMNLLEECLEINYGIKKEDFCIKDNKSVYRINIEQMEKTKKGKMIKEILSKEYKDIKETFLTSAQLYIILISLSNDIDFISTLETLRNIETNVRNVTAHKIISVTDEWIEKTVSLNSYDIMELLKKIALKAKLNIKKEYWNSYDDMNEIIIENLCI